MDTPVTRITKQITEALENDPRMKGNFVDVSYNQGVVTLTGTVRSQAASQAAEEIARSQPEVVSVVNELRVGKI